MNRVSAAVAPTSRSTASRSTTSKYSSNLDRSWPPSASANSLDHGLQVHLWVTRSQPPSASPNLLDHGLQVHLWVHSILTSKCIAKLDWSRPLSSHDHGLQVHLRTRSITACNCISEFNLISASKCIPKLAESQPPSASLSSTWMQPPSASLSYSISASKCISKSTQS